MELEFEGVEGYRFDRLLDLKVDVTLALVGPRVRGLEVEEGDGVVDWFDTVAESASWSSLKRGSSILIWEDISIRSHLDKSAGSLTRAVSSTQPC